MDFFLRGVLSPPTLSSGIWCRDLFQDFIQDPSIYYYNLNLFIIIHPSRGLSFYWIGFAVTWRCACLGLGISRLSWRTAPSPPTDCVLAISSDCILFFKCFYLDDFSFPLISILYTLVFLFLSRFIFLPYRIHIYVCSHSFLL